MKVTRTYGVLCILNIIKIVIFFMFMGDVLSSNWAIGVSLPSLFVFLAMAINDDLKYVSLIGVIGIILLWLAILVVSILGMKYQKIQIVTVILTTIVALLDLLLPVIFSSIEIKLGAVLMSACVFSVCGKVCFDLKRKE